MSPETLHALKHALAIGSLGGIIKALLHPSKFWMDRMIVFILSVSISVLVAILLEDSKLPYDWKAPLIGASALLGQEIIETVIKLIPALTKRYLNAIIKKIRIL